MITEMSDSKVAFHFIFFCEGQSIMCLHNRMTERIMCKDCDDSFINHKHERV